MLNSIVHVINRNVVSSFISRKILLCNNTDSFRYFTKTLSIYAQPENRDQERVLNVAIIGIPNSGKSTLINNLVDRRVCPTSNKVHTTKKTAKAIINDDNTQVIFLDTPGIVSPSEQKRYSLAQSMASAPKTSLSNADIVGVIQDVSNPFNREKLSPLIVNILEKHDNIPSFLILNKIDLLKSKRRLLDLVRTLCNGMVAGRSILKHSAKSQEEFPKKMNGFSGFSDVFMVSALEGDGVDLIKKYLVQNAKPGKWVFPQKDWSDQTPEDLIMETVRAKFMDFLHQEIPYKLVTELEFLEEKADSDRLICVVSVTCPSERIEKLIAGAGGGKLRQITDSARHDLVKLFHVPISLTISLRVNSKLEE